MKTKLSAFGRAALVYAAAGFPVFPCLPRDKSPHTDLVPHGHKEATTDPAKIERWWTAEPQANVGLVPGPGYAVVDVDPANGGRASLRALANGRALSTLTAETGGGGQHYLFSDAPEGLPGKLADGIDLKRHGRGYVVVSPSIHPSGRRYKWADGWKPDTIAKWPAWLTPKPEANRKANDPEERTPLTPTQLRNLLKQIDADDYEKWIAVGQILRSEYGDENGFPIWRRWSKRSDKYPGDAELERKWKSFRSGGRGIGSLVHMAGGKVPNPSAEEQFADAPIPEADLPTPQSVLHVTRFSDITAKRVDWLVPGYVAKGVLHCVAGYGGEGKSSAVSALVAACTNGTNWITSQPIPAGPVSVAVITEEPVEYQTAPRLKLCGADMKRVLNIDGVGPKRDQLELWNLIDHVQKTREFLKANPDVQLLLIDPIGGYMHSKKRELNTWKDSDVRLALGPWQKLAEDLNVAIVYIAHHAKGKADRVMNLVTGSAAFTTVTRMSYAVMEPPRGYLRQFGLEEEDEPEIKDESDYLTSHRVMFATKVNIGPTPPPVVLKFEPDQDSDNPKVSVVGKLPRIKAEELYEQFRANDKASQRASPLQDKILAFVKEHPGLSKSAVCEAVGVGPTSESGQSAFDRLEKRGLIYIHLAPKNVHLVYVSGEGPENSAAIQQGDKHG
jgi:hypothetical protein